MNNVIRIVSVYFRDLFREPEPIIECPACYGEYAGYAECPWCLRIREREQCALMARRRNAAIRA